MTTDDEEAKKWRKAGAKVTSEDVAAARKKAQEVLERWGSHRKHDFESGNCWCNELFH